MAEIILFLPPRPTLCRGRVRHRQRRWADGVRQAEEVMDPMMLKAGWLVTAPVGCMGRARGDLAQHGADGGARYFPGSRR
jgi:hypothetical protein